MILRAHGLEIALPAGWDGRIYRRDHGDPTLHAASFPLPRRDGDFGTAATSGMPPGGVFFVVTEYRPGPGLVPGQGLFASTELPLPLHPERFSPRALLRALPGQAGYQHFFTTGGRPFCLYAVRRVSTPTRRRGRAHGTAARAGLDALNGALASLAVDPS